MKRYLTGAAAGAAVAVFTLAGFSMANANTDDAVRCSYQVIRISDGYGYYRIYACVVEDGGSEEPPGNYPPPHPPPTTTSPPMTTTTPTIPTDPPPTSQPTPAHTKF